MSSYFIYLLIIKLVHSFSEYERISECSKYNHTTLIYRGKICCLCVSVYLFGACKWGHNLTGFQKRTVIFTCVLLSLVVVLWSPPQDLQGRALCRSAACVCTIWTLMFRLTCTTAQKCSHTEKLPLVTVNHHHSLMPQCLAPCPTTRQPSRSGHD